MSQPDGMRIALSAPEINLTGGIERVVVETANWLSRAGNDVRVYATRVDRRVLDDDVHVTQVAVPRRMNAITGFGFRRPAAAAILSDKPDVHGSFSALCPRGGVYWIPSVHRVAYDMLLSRRSPVQQVPVRLHPFHHGRLQLERTMMEPGGYARLLALTETDKADVHRSYGVPTAEIDVLAPGFDPTAFSPSRRLRLRAQARAQLGYRPEDRVLLFVANELERKGFDVLLRAIARLGDPAVKLLGAGRVTPDGYRPLVEQLGLTDALQWVGSCEDVPLLHAAGDAFVLPTRYEPWGLVIVEALGSGLPVVTTRLAGASLAVQDGKTGRLLDDPDDPAALTEALRWALSYAPATPEEIAASAGPWSWKHVIGRYESILRSTIAAGASSFASART